MKVIVSLFAMLLAALLSSCVRSNTVEGVVSDVTENTLTIVTEEDALVTFSIRDAKVRGSAGLCKGAFVEVDYTDDISDGFGNARTVEILDCGEVE